MAKLTGGLLGTSTGKIGNIVTAKWKGINYAREMVTPANPNTQAQQTIRNLFTAIVFIGRAIFSSFVMTYWNPLVAGKNNTGWAKFVGVNIKGCQSLTDLQNLKMATGDLEGVSNPLIGLDLPNNTVEITFSLDTVGNGQLSDEVFAFCYSVERGYLYPQTSGATRDDEEVSVIIPKLSDLNEVFFYITMKGASGKYSTTQGFKVTIP